MPNNRPMPARPNTKLLAMLFACAMGVLIGGNAVLCVGSNGHLALERFEARCCSESRLSFAAEAAPASTRVARRADCVGCTDTELLAAAPSARSSSKEATALLTAPMAALRPPIERVDAVAALQTPDRLLRSDPSLLFARTTSLRC